MTASFSWIDNSTEDRRRMLDAIDQLKETESRDELGLATVRDGFADALFPGTSTIQTRAAYFLFVPWIYRELTRRRLTHDQVEAAGRKEEVKLIHSLMASDDDAGIIGKVAQEKLKRLPSSVYWNGLRTWGIRQFDGSIDEYNRNFEGFREASESSRDDDGQLLGGSSRRDWHAGLPVAPADFPKVASLTLRKEDREYLAERITLTVGSSLLGWLLRNAKSLEGEGPWDQAQSEEFPEQIQRTLTHAHCFSDVMLGAPALYNLMLAESLPEGDARIALVERYREALLEWSQTVGPRASALATWSTKTFWSFCRPLLQVGGPTMRFVDEWVSLRGWEKPDGLASSDTARALIRQRERQLKGPRARLGNPRALELWGTDSGIGRLVYRWPSAVRILKDIRPELTIHAES